MTDGLVARPGDGDLDCHLTGLRLTAVHAIRSEDYAAEAMLTFSTMDAGGSYKTGSATRWPDGKDIQVPFGLRSSRGEATVTMAMLRKWRRKGAYVEMTCAPGKATLLRSKGECVVLPRSETAVSAGRETGS